MKDIPNHETKYAIDEYGNVWSKRKQRFFKWLPNIHKGKVKRYMVTFRPGNKNHSIHTLVYTSFIGPVPKGYVIHHKDRNPANNHISNLIAMTHSDHSKLHQLMRKYDL